MKSSWIIGLFMLFIGFQILASTASGGAPLSDTGGGINTTQIDTLMKPTGVDSTSSITGIYSAVTKVWGYLVLIGDMLFWNYPALFSGNWAYIRYLFLIPLSIGMIASFVIIMRGSGTS